MSIRWRPYAGCILLLAAIQISSSAADQVPVRDKEGLMHGFLSLRGVDGKKLAEGETTQVANGDLVSDHLIFRFSDGSLYEDTTEFTQKSNFRLVRDHLIEKGPSFKQPMETWIDTTTGQVKVEYKDKSGKTRTIQQKLDLPPDLSNGLVFTVIKDVDTHTPQITLSYLATTPKPRVIKFVIVPEARKPLTSGSAEKAVVYDMKVKIGGIAGMVAHIAGKQPPDTHIWVLPGEAPTFIKSEGPLYDGGPIWKIEVVSPPGNR